MKDFDSFAKENKVPENGIPDDVADAAKKMAPSADNRMNEGRSRSLSFFPAFIRIRRRFRNSNKILPAYFLRVVFGSEPVHDKI